MVRDNYSPCVMIVIGMGIELKKIPVLIVVPWRSITIELLPSPSVVADVFGVTLMVTSRELAEVKKNERCVCHV